MLKGTDGGDAFKSFKLRDVFLPSNLDDKLEGLRDSI